MTQIAVFFVCSYTPVAAKFGKRYPALEILGLLGVFWLAHHSLTQPTVFKLQNHVHCQKTV